MPFGFNDWINDRKVGRCKKLDTVITSKCSSSLREIERYIEVFIFNLLDSFRMIKLEKFTITFIDENNGTEYIL